MGKGGKWHHYWWCRLYYLWSGWFAPDVCWVVGWECILVILCKVSSRVSYTANKNDGRHSLNQVFQVGKLAVCKHALWKMRSSSISLVPDPFPSTKSHLKVEGRGTCRNTPYRGFSRRPCWRAETMKQFCMKIYLISEGRENVLFMPSSMAAMTSRQNALFIKAAAIN